MAKEFFRRDDNYIPVIGGVTDDATQETKQLRVDPTSLRLKVDSNSSDGAASVGSDNGAVTTAGTPVQLPDIDCRRVRIVCSEWNGDVANCSLGGIIVVGGSNVDATLATRIGTPLFPTQGDWFNVSNLSLLYIDSLDDGAKYHYYYET